MITMRRKPNGFETFGMRQRKSRSWANNVAIGLQDRDVDEEALSRQFEDWPVDGMKITIIARPKATLEGYYGNKLHDIYGYGAE